MNFEYSCLDRINTDELLKQFGYNATEKYKLNGCKSKSCE